MSTQKIIGSWKTLASSGQIRYFRREELSNGQVRTRRISKIEANSLQSNLDNNNTERHRPNGSGRTSSRKKVQKTQVNPSVRARGTRGTRAATASKARTESKTGTDSKARTVSKADAVSKKGVKGAVSKARAVSNGQKMDAEAKAKTRVDSFHQPESLSFGFDVKNFEVMRTTKRSRVEETVFYRAPGTSSFKVPFDMTGTLEGSFGVVSKYEINALGKRLLQSAGPKAAANLNFVVKRFRKGGEEDPLTMAAAEVQKYKQVITDLSTHKSWCVENQKGRPCTCASKIVQVWQKGDPSEVYMPLFDGDFDSLEGSKKAFSCEEAYGILAELDVLIDHLSEAGWQYTDLKAENLLYRRTKEQQLEWVICDVDGFCSVDDDDCIMTYVPCSSDPVPSSRKNKNKTDSYRVAMERALADRSHSLEYVRAATKIEVLLLAKDKPNDPVSRKLWKKIQDHKRDDVGLFPYFSDEMPAAECDRAFELSTQIGKALQNQAASFPKKKDKASRFFDELLKTHEAYHTHLRLRNTAFSTSTQLSKRSNSRGWKIRK